MRAEYKKRHWKLQKEAAMMWCQLNQKQEWRNKMEKWRGR